MQYDFWTEPSKVGAQVDIFVSAKAASSLIANLRKRGIQYTVSKTNVER